MKIMTNTVEIISSAAVSYDSEWAEEIWRQRKDDDDYFIIIISEVISNLLKWIIIPTTMFDEKQYINDLGTQYLYTISTECPLQLCFSERLIHGKQFQDILDSLKWKNYNKIRSFLSLNQIWISAHQNASEIKWFVLFVHLRKLCIF